MTSTDVLDLSAIAEPRERARLRTKKNPEGLKPDGSEYELANLEDLAPVQITQFNDAFQEANELWTTTALDEAGAARLEELYTDLAAMVILTAPRADVAALRLVDRRGVVLRFWSALSLTTYSTIGDRALGAMTELSRRASQRSERS